jgi:hypothetical protein
MMDTTLITGVFGFAMLLVGLALTGYEFSRISRLRPQRIDETRGMPRKRDR